MTTVHDISEQIAQIFPWNLGIALQVVEQNVAADGQVTRVEGIVSVPALGAEFASLGNHGMEVAQRKQNRLEFILLGAHLQRVLVEVVQSLVQVGLHAGWRFIGDLDGSLQNTLEFRI